MKRLIAITLTCALIVSALSGCTNESNTSISSEASVDSFVEETTRVADDAAVVENKSEGVTVEDKLTVESSIKDSIEIAVDETTDEIPDFQALDDPELLQYIEDTVYVGLTDQFASEDYIIEEVSAIYLSNEYLEEVAYNSKANIWFGHTLAELDEQFQGQPYVFTLGDDGTTVVKPFEDYDDTYDRVIKNIAIGTGVILVCVTVSVVTGGLGAAPVSMIFAASAKTATTMALSSGAFSAIFSAAVTGIQTKDFDAAMKSAALQGSEGYKWGAITGVVTGGFAKTVEIKKEADRVKAIQAAMESAEEWRQAELRALMEYGGKEQISYLAGEEVMANTPGATRPDVVRIVGDHIEAIEVKYYNLESQASLSTLYRELEREVGSRVVNLPTGSTQRIVLDVTGRGFTAATTETVKKTIVEKLFDIYPNIPIDIVGL